MLHVRAAGVRIDESDMIAEEGAKNNVLSSQSTAFRTDLPVPLGFSRLSKVGRQSGPRVVASACGSRHAAPPPTSQAPDADGQR